MIKFIEAPDLHCAPEHRDINIANAARIAEAERENAVDFIALPGDLFNSPLIATTKGGLTDVINMVKNWLKICPVVAVEGTPSHDGPGAYAALEECGLILLRPGYVYALVANNGFQKITLSKYYNEIEYGPRRAILFGIPELNTDNILSRLQISAEEANAEAVKQLQNYIERFIAPERAKYPDIPAIGLLHGVVSDTAQEFSDDVVIRSSDIVIKTDVLARANLTRWSLGHIHTPWESKKISAGYAGSWGINWKERGFVPAMNLVEIYDRKISIDEFKHPSTGIRKIESFTTTLSRIPYGTPRREKINRPAGAINPEVAYWLETDDPDARLAADLHPWSRVTRKAAQRETQRITAQQAANVRSLADLFRLIDLSVTPEVLALVEKITEAIPEPPMNPVKVSVDEITVKGCDFWRGRTFTVRPTDWPSMTLLLGDNGDGKSAAAGFLTPYPIIVGKDTKSGRASAIKDFFSGRDSSIEKILTVNSQQHRHLITLKGAHTETCKGECYLWIDGASQLDCGTFDEMFNECERLYGPYQDYLLTTFYVQPLQGKTGSSLMSATMTEIRDLVQAIAGIDREKEKRFALDEVKRLEDALAAIESWLQGAEAFAVDIDALISQREKEKAARTGLAETLKLIENDGKKISDDLSKAREAAAASNEQENLKRMNEARTGKLKTEANELRGIIERQNILADALPEYRARLTSIQVRDEILAANRQLKLDYDTLVLAYNSDLSALRESRKRANDENQEQYRKQQDAYDRTKKIIELNICELESEIKRLNTPCEKCGYLAEDATEAIRLATQAIKESKEKLHGLALPPVPVLVPIPTELEMPLPTQPVYAVAPHVEGTAASVQMLIEQALTASEKGTAALKQKLGGEIEIKMLEAIKYAIDPEAHEVVARLEVEYAKHRDAYTATKSDLVLTEQNISSLSSAILEAQKHQDELRRKRIECASLAIEETNWKYIAAMLQPAKIPALELDLVIDAIDEAATKNIAPYRDGIYSFHTTTQAQGKKAAVDRFDILVHNDETGLDKSFLYFSPGQKAFLNDAYVKALIQQRNDRAHREYSPIISDEADEPIKPERIAEFYEMQTAYYSASAARVVVISHAVNAHMYIQKQISIKECLQ